MKSERMQSFVLLMLGIFLMANTIGCDMSKSPSINNDVASLKGSIWEFDKGITIGQAFDNYSFFKGTQWKSFTTPNGRKIVEFAGVWNLEKIDADANTSYVRERVQYLKNYLKDIEFVVQFSKNADNTFQVYKRGERRIYINGIEKDDLVDDYNSDEFLKIYKNKSSMPFLIWGAIEIVSTTIKGDLGLK